VTETIESSTAAPKKRGGGLNSMLLADLKSLAGGLGVAGAGSMKKAQLVEAIKAAQSGGSGSGAAPAQEKPAQERPARQRPARAKSARAEADEQPELPVAAEPTEPPKADRKPRQARQAKQAKQDPPVEDRQERAEPEERPDRGQQRERGQQNREQQNREQQNREQQGREQQGRDQQGRDQQGRDQQGRDQQNRDQQGRDQQNRDQQNRDQQNRDQQNRDQQNRDQQGRDQQGRDQQNRDQQNREQDGDADGEGRGRNRRRRGRDRDRPAAAARSTDAPPRGRNEPDTTILEDDVLVPAAGILDVLDNYAFVRTSGYLPGTDDVYVSLSMVRKFGLRRGDAVVGQVRQPREGERKEKFNPMVRIDSVNGADPETSKHRVDFDKLTPLHPAERLRLETGPDNLIGRVIDITAPIGKGQRGLIVSPAKAGKTMVLQSIAASIAANNPECHLMVVLVDERPEEVVDFERSVKGEVISSTFDRPPADHTMVAELAIERAKRLVELGHDVVVLLDGITRLGRAYNLSTPASGRILSGGVDSAALYPPKRFFGAARNVENGGSLTIVATALVESGSKMDEVIFEEFKGTGNMELRLRRDLADQRLYPAVDAVSSGTRREELLLTEEELAIVWKLRRVLSPLEGQQAHELLLGRLKKTQSNYEFLLQVQKTTPTAGDDD